MSDSVNAAEELTRYARFVGNRASGLFSFLLAPVEYEDDSAINREWAEHEANEFAGEIADEEDSDWVEIRNGRRAIPEENDQDIYRQVREGGPISQTALKLQEKALENALEAAGITGRALKAVLEAAAEDSGWVSNCATVDHMLRMAVLKYPILNGFGSTMKDISKAFVAGRRAAGDARRVAATVATSAASRMPRRTAANLAMLDAESIRAHNASQESRRGSSATSAHVGPSKPISWASGQDIEEVDIDD